MNRVCIIDNYDSFTYNLLHYFESLDCEVIVILNDDSDVFQKVEKYSPSHIVLSPGPGLPKNAGKLFLIIKNFYDKIPMLGVCLGHQAIAEIFGAKLILAQSIMHGKTSLIAHHKKDLFNNIPSPFTAMRYHSWIIDRADFPKCLQISAYSSSADNIDSDFSSFNNISDDNISKNEIMAFRHKEYPIFCVQFHPESIGTQYGYLLISNFLRAKKNENI